MTSTLQEKLIKAMRSTISAGAEWYLPAFADASVVDAYGKVQIPADCLLL